MRTAALAPLSAPGLARSLRDRRIRRALRLHVVVGREPLAGFASMKSPDTAARSLLSPLPAGRRLPTPARVLLLNLNDYDQPYAVYPIGLAYLCGALEAAGCSTRIWDCRFTGEPLEAAIAGFTPDLIGISMRNVDNVQYHNPRSFVQEVVDCCARLRALSSAPLVLGGSAFSVFPAELFELTGVDYGVRGAGEETLVRLIRALQTDGVVTGIDGLYHRAGAPDGAGAARALEAAGFCAEPAHDPALLSAYARQGSLPGIQTQRGCPLHCCYCTYPLIEGRRSRFRSPQAVVAEMRRLADAGVHYTFIVDSVFNTRRDHVTAVCEALIAAKIDMHWECFLRPGGIDRDLLHLMQRAGLRHVEFGSDSFADDVLARYGKSFTFDEIRSASEEAHALGLHYSHFIIFGGPGETPETVEETLRRSAQLPGAYYFATIGMRIYPHTPLWRMLAPSGAGETTADYLPQPRFYLAPGFTAAGLYARLAEVKRTSHNWIVGDPPPAFRTTIEKLRARGIRGPLWEYIELLQRIDPQQEVRPRIEPSSAA